MAARAGSTDLLASLLAAKQKAEAAPVPAPFSFQQFAQQGNKAAQDAAYGLTDFIGNEGKRLWDGKFGIDTLAQSLPSLAQSGPTNLLEALKTQRGGWANSDLQSQRDRGDMGQAAGGALDLSLLASAVGPTIRGAKAAGEGFADFALRTEPGMRMFGYESKNVAPTFAGPLSKTADHKALDLAKELARKGSNRDDIWNQTGWFQGENKKWRYEIDDSGSTRIAHPFPSTDFTGKLSEALDHPDLYAAYPDLAEAGSTLRGSIGPEGGWGAYQAPQKGGLFRKPVSENVAATSEGRIIPAEVDIGRQNLTHEIQHAIQQREGFDLGSNPKSAAAIQKAQEQGLTPQDIYRLDPGEVEARNAARRRNLTPEQRQAMPPWETADPTTISQEAVQPKIFNPSQLNIMGFWSGSDDGKPLLSSLLERFRKPNAAPAIEGQYTVAPPTSIDDIAPDSFFAPQGARQDLTPLSPSDGMPVTAPAQYDPQTGAWAGGDSMTGAGAKNAATLAEALAKRNAKPPGYDDWSPEWRAAFDKGLPMDTASRMARAREQGFTTPVYHGTTSDFPAFDGIAISPEMDIGTHVGNAAQANNRITDRFPGGVRDVKSGGRIMPLLANIQNPLRLKDPNMWTEGKVVEQLEQLSHPGFPLDRPMRKGIGAGEIKREIRGQGNDGIVYANDGEGPGDSYIAFDPSQLRSTSAAFDPANVGKPNLLGMGPVLQDWNGALVNKKLEELLAQYGMFGAYGLGTATGLKALSETQNPSR